MIASFRNKGLQELFDTGRSARVPADMRKRIIVRLDALDAAKTLADLDRPGFRLHPLKGTAAGRYAIDVNGPWRLTFAWKDGTVSALDLEQYH